MDILTVEQYADLRGITKSAVYNSIYANRVLPGISLYQKTGKVYLLHGEKEKINKNVK